MKVWEVLEASLRSENSGKLRRSKSLLDGFLALMPLKVKGQRSEVLFDQVKRFMCLKLQVRVGVLR